MIAELKTEWQLLKHDRPGERFENHRRRVQKKSKAHRVALAVVGCALIAVGVVFCVLPGPGSLGIVLGLALLGGMSRTIARLMDRAEPKMRAGLHRANAFWHRLSTPKKALLITVTTVVVVMGAFVVWKNWMGPVVESYVGDL